MSKKLIGIVLMSALLGTFASASLAGPATAAPVAVAKDNKAICIGQCVEEAGACMQKDGSNKFGCLKEAEVCKKACK